MKKWTTALLVFVMIFSLVACGKENTGNSEEVSADTTTTETTDNSTGEVVSDETDVVESTTPPTETPTETPTEAPTSEPTEAPTETPTEVPAEQPTETPEPYTYTDLDQVMYAKQSVNVRSIPSADGEKLGGLSQNDEVHVTGQCNESGWYRIEYNGGIGYVSNNYLVNEKVVTSSNNPENSTNNPTGTVEPEPTTPVTPPSSGNGDNLSFSGSTTLPSGLTISTLNEFNNAGMDTSFDNSWFGDVNSDVAAQNYGTMIDNFDNFNGVWSHSAINVTSNARIEWRSDLSNATGAIELRKSSDYEQYNIIIRGPYLDLATAESMGWSLGNSGDAPAKEALVTLLSAITPNCVEVKDAIVASLYTAPNGQEPISIDGSWATIGDCQVRLNSWDTDNGNYIFVFNIRGK